MAGLAGVYLFLLGLASGLTLLTCSAYRRVSPAWLRWLLFATGLLVLGRYLTLALFTHPEAPQRLGSLRHLWFGSAIGLTLPSVMAIDQLLRHPAMSPQKLLRWYAPFLLAYGAVLAFGDFQAEPDRVVGWTLHVGLGWRRALSVVQGVFVAGFISLCAFLGRKVPSPPIRSALVGLALGQACLGLDGLILALGGWYFRPFLFSEMLMLAALWHAYETSHRLQQGG